MYIPYVQYIIKHININYLLKLTYGLDLFKMLEFFLQEAVCIQAVYIFTPPIKFNYNWKMHNDDKL